MSNCVAEEFEMSGKLTEDGPCGCAGRRTVGLRAGTSGGRARTPGCLRTSTSRNVPYVMVFVFIVCGLLCVSSAQQQAGRPFPPVDFGYEENHDIPPTMFLQQPQAGIPEIRGNTKVLLCAGTGSPSAVYRWRKDGEYITEYNITEQSLKLQDIKRSDAGMYQCIASNTAGAILSNQVHVTVAYLMPFPHTMTREKTVDQGQACVIDLPPIDSYPPPSIQWFEGARPILKSHRVHVTLQNQLVLLETRIEDNNKQFEAKATNPYTSQTSDSQRFTLRIQNVGSNSADIPPSIVIPPSHTKVIQGPRAAAKLECVANARSLNYLSLNWYRKTGASSRTMIRQDNLKYLYSRFRRQLTILNPVVSDTGVYECEALFNRTGGPSFPAAVARANLTVLVKPRFKRLPQTEISRDYGSDVDIPCHAVGTPMPKVIWYRNAVVIEEGFRGRYTINEEGMLHIDEVNPTDSGMFQCFVLNEAGDINAATWLKVLSSPPAIITKPVNTTLIAEDTVQIPCEVTGAPKPSVAWYRVTEARGSQDLTSATGRIQVHDSELLITRAGVADSGKYVCNATNNKGIAVASAHLIVFLRTHITEPPQDASVIKGSTHTIKCTVEHDADIAVTWRWDHQGINIPHGQDRREILFGGSLMIRSVRNEDIGTYRCNVTSNAGNDTGKADLRVIELPYPPSVNHVQLDPKEVRTVNVKWSPGFNGNSPITRFIVQYRLVPPGTEMLDSEGWVVADDSVAAGETEYSVRRLLPARSYQFRVSAVNDVGEGPGSKPSESITLPQQPPSGPPRDVVGSPRSETRIILRWQPPDEDKWNGPLQGYLIRYKPSGYPDATLAYENVTSRLVEMFELRGLIVFQEYEIAIAAYNKKGAGVYSSTIYVRTKEGRPTQAPRNVATTAVNSTSIKISWLPPNPQHINGINQGYKIKAMVVDSPDSVVWVTIPSDTSNMLGEQTGHLARLAKFTVYEIGILCFTSKGDGPMSPAVTVKTMEDVPDAVGNLIFDNVLDTSLQVHWTPPPNVNGILIGYTLSYMRKNNTISKVSHDLTATTQNYTIVGLTATTTYTIELFAKTRVGAGPVRSADIESGVPPERPGPPRNLAITNIGAASVLIQFIPGFSGHTSITKWVIEAQVNGADDWEVIFTKIDPPATSVLVEGLRPYTSYTLRMLALNVAGRSLPSQPTRTFQTIQAAPDSPPIEVTVRADNETAIRVRWKPLASHLWNGEGRGYLIQYREHEDPNFLTTIEIKDENANSYTFTRLEEWTQYDVRAASYNKVGQSKYSPIASERTRESVPSKGPSEINATALSSTTIRVEWSDIKHRDENGNILGFKVFYNVANKAWLEPLVEDIKNSQARETVLTELKKYTQYRIKVLGYTRIGDGVLSPPAPIVKTNEDVPGPPSSVYFPDVTHTTVHVVWSPPREPNGIIVGYVVKYYAKEEGEAFAIEEDGLGPNAHELSVSHLKRRTFYMFTVSARTKLGKGEPARLEVFTILDRTVPDPPSRPQIGMSAVGDRWVTVNWQPGNNGYSPVRNFTIQQRIDAGDWVTLDDLVSHDAVAYSIRGLKPNTKYEFRVAAVNDIGSSDFSEQSEQVITKQAAPETPPTELRAIPKTTTSVLITWKPLAALEWNGDRLGYEVWYRQLDRHISSLPSGASYSPVQVTYPLTSIELTNLLAGVYYEVKVNAFNGRGHGPFSRPVDVYVGEAVPTQPPENARAGVLSSTAIKLMWEAPAEDSWNGDLLGFKIFYWEEASPDKGSTVKTVAATELETELPALKMFTEYAMLILAFNAAGDGPNITVPIIAKTQEGVPGKPGQLYFMVTSLTSLNVSWEHPVQANGHIILYEVSYYQDADINGEKITRRKRSTGESRSVQVKLAGDRLFYEARELNENVKYIFSVRAQTKVGWGPAQQGNITTGPQKGSPERPSKPSVIEGQTSVTIQWENSDEGSSPIIGYIIQAMEKGESKWRTEMRKQSPESEAIISLLNLKPNSEYQFRVISLNSVGISSPSLPSGYFKTLKVENQPFYQQFWFLIIVALTGVIFIIIVISVLCWTGRNKKSKYKGYGLCAMCSSKLSTSQDAIPKTTIHLQPEQDGASGAEDGGFPTFEMRRSNRRSERRPPKTTLPPYTRSNYMSPPRPSPGSVNYSDGEESKYPDEESSSLTEKPSEISSSASDSQGSESDGEDEKELPPPPFPNHYTNGSVQQSWNRHTPYAPHLPPRGQAAYNYTDSEPESQYAVTLNGGHVIMNNMAGSRAPLPGFSSFV